MKAIKRCLCLLLVMCMALTIVCLADDTTAQTSSGTQTTTGTQATTGTQTTTGTQATTGTQTTTGTQATTGTQTTTGTQATTGTVTAGVAESGEPVIFSDIDYSETLGQAVEKLTDNKIISGFPDGTFKPDQTLTRAEFSKIIVSFTAGADTAVNLDSGFPDVDNVGGSAHWAKPYIKAAKDLKIISGFPDGTFQPDSPVTYEQAVKMIMCALNYTEYTYPEGFLQIAMQKRLLVNSTHKGENSAPIKRGSAAILVYNGLSITPKKNSEATFTGVTGITGGGSSSSGGGGGGGGGSSSGTWSRTVSGVVWGNTYTMLDTAVTTVDTDEIAIRYTQKDKDGTEKVKTETLRLADKYAKNAANYLGKNVKATVKEDEDGKEYIDSLTVLENRNYSLSVSINDFVSFTYNESEKCYVMEYITSDDKIAKHNFNPDNIYLIYNKKSINLDEDAEKYEFKPEYVNEAKLGSFTILSNDTDKKGDVILVTDYKTGVVNTKNTSTGIIKFKYGLGDLDAGTKGREVSIVSSNGGYDVAVSDLRAFDVLDYSMSEDQKVLSVRVSAAAEKSNVISGTVTKITEDKIYIKASGAATAKEYELNYSYLDYLNNYEEDNKYYPVREDNVKIHLNSFGKVAAIEQITSTTVDKYGYIANLGFASGKGEPEEDDAVQLKMHEINKSGTTTTGLNILKVAKNVRVDGVLYKNDPSAVEEVIIEAARVANEGKITGNSNTKYASFIRYEISGGEISVIDTILDGQGKLSTESDERYNTLVRSTYVYNENEDRNGRFAYYSGSPIGFYKEKAADRFRVRANSTSTLWMFVPGNRLSSNYKSGKFVSSDFYNGMEYYVEAYNVDSSKYAQFVLQYITNGKEDVSAYSSTVAAVVSVETEDETGTDKITYRAYSSNTASSKKISEGSPASKKFDSLNTGDIILFSQDISGEIYDYYLALDINNLPIRRIDNEELLYCTSDTSDRRIKGFNVYPDGTQSTGVNNTRFRTLYGTAVEYKDYCLSVNPVLSTDYMEPSDALTEEFDIIQSKTKLFVYDESVPASSDKRFKAYSTRPDIDKFFKGEDEEGFGFVSAADNGGNYDGADHVFIYTYSASSSNFETRFIYVIRTAKQSNPDNYEGVETPVPDPLKAEKEAAMAELSAYAQPSEYPSIQDRLEEAVISAKAAVDSAQTNTAIQEAVSQGKAAIDEIILNLKKTEAKDELLTYAESVYSSYASDEGFLSYLNSLNDSLDGAENTTDLESRLTEAKNGIDTYYAENVTLSSDGEAPADEK